MTGEAGGRPVAVLIGPPGSGKTSVGPLLADRLNASFLDTDDEVASIVRKPVGDIFVEDGEQAFRALERVVVQRALRYHGVVALGSGAVADDQTRQLLAGHRVIYLETGFADVAKRSGLSRPRIPVPGNPRGRLRAMLEERRPLYEQLAVLTIGTDGLSPEEIALRIANEQQIAVGRVPRISVALPAGSPPARRSADPRRHGSAEHDPNAEHGR